LAHKLFDLGSAKVSYRLTIDKAKEEPWYFAPNSCLQLGYLALEEKKPEEAIQYFNRALTYNKHDYKNSIDSKAKTALAQIRRK
jgi:hypothetical protein